MAPADVLTRLLLAAGLGALIGIEREWRQKPAGLRTNMLIAMGAALFTIVSIKLGAAGGSSDRVAAQIITGIGFLGAGAILRDGASIHGLTTAATIWVNAAVGMTVGIGDYAIATATTIASLIVLSVLGPLERYFERRLESRSIIAPPDPRPRP